MKLLSPSRFCNSFPSPLPHNLSVKFSSISFSSFQFSPPPCISHSISSHTRNHSYNARIRRRRRNIFIGSCTTSSKNVELESKSSDSNGDSSSSPDFDCVGTGLDVECLVSSSPSSETNGKMFVVEGGGGGDELKSDLLEMMVETGVLVSPFFFWGTAMVAMKEVLPLVGPFFVASFRLIPAGLLLVAFAASKGRPLPSGFTAWLSIALFGLVDAACFQVL